MDQVYLSGAITQKMSKEDYQKIARHIRKQGVEVKISHEIVDTPQKGYNYHMTAYWEVKREIEKSKLLLAYVGEESFITGMEIGHAENKNVRIILFHEEDVRIHRIFDCFTKVKREIYSTSPVILWQAVQPYLIP